MAIKWTQSKEINVAKKVFKVFISERSNGLYYCTILYYEKAEAIQVFSDIPNDIEFKSFTTLGKTESEAKDKMQNWIKDSFRENIEI